MILNTIALSLLALSQSISSLTLLSQGEAQGGYKTYGLAEVYESQLYKKTSPAFDRFIVMPEVASAAAVLSANGRLLSLTLNTEMAVQSDLSKLKIPLNKREVSLQDLHDKLDVELSAEFLGYLEELKEQYPEGIFQADDRRGGDRRMYRAKLADLNPDALNRTLGILYRASIKAARPFSLYLQVPEDRGMELSKLKDMTIASVGVSLPRVDIQESRVDIDLPAMKDWSDLSEGTSLPFYEGLRHLDEKLIPYLVNEEAFALKSFPDRSWRRLVLERAMNVYFSDPDAPNQRACDVYRIGIRSASSGELISMNLYWPLFSKVLIPHRVNRVEQN